MHAVNYRGTAASTSTVTGIPPTNRLRDWYESRSQPAGGRHDDTGLAAGVIGKIREVLAFSHIVSCILVASPLVLIRGNKEWKGTLTYVPPFNPD